MSWTKRPINWYLQIPTIDLYIQNTKNEFAYLKKIEKSWATDDYILVAIWIQKLLKEFLPRPT